MRVVVKVGTSSVTDRRGKLDIGGLEKICREVVGTRREGHEVVLVTSGAIAAGLPAVGIDPHRRPRDSRTLQAVAAVGQVLLMEHYHRLLGPLGVVPGQVLLVPNDFWSRDQYLHARDTMTRLLELGVLPVVNENDAIADDEIRMGDNDRIAALVAQALQADLLVLLTDTPGLLTADPRVDESASLIEEIVDVDRALEAMAGGAGSESGSGGMATKLAAAKMAAWTGVRAVIAGAGRPGVLADAIAARPGVGTTVHPRSPGLSARKAWIAFAVEADGRLRVDAGARDALESHGRSLLAAGLTGVEGDFRPEGAVEILGADGQAFAKGLVRLGAPELRSWCERTAPTGRSPVVVHRDDLVILPA